MKYYITMIDDNDRTWFADGYESREDAEADAKHFEKKGYKDIRICEEAKGV